jgi:hypothetical protein
MIGYPTLAICQAKDEILLPTCIDFGLEEFCVRVTFLHILYVCALPLPCSIKNHQANDMPLEPLAQV